MLTFPASCSPRGQPQGAQGGKHRRSFRWAWASPPSCVPRLGSPSSSYYFPSFSNSSQGTFSLLLKMLCTLHIRYVHIANYSSSFLNKKNRHLFVPTFPSQTRFFSNKRLFELRAPLSRFNMGETEWPRPALRRPQESGELSLRSLWSTDGRKTMSQLGLGPSIIKPCCT